MDLPFWLENNISRFHQIHVFLSLRYRRLRFKRRLAKLAYRFLSILRLNRWFSWWSPGGGCPLARKNNTGSNSSGGISRSSSFNWSADFGPDHSHHYEHHHHLCQSETGYPSKMTYDEAALQNKQDSNQYFNSQQQPEYKCNSSGLYCNHCYCRDNCGSPSMTFDPQRKLTSLGETQSAHQQLHTTFYCTCNVPDTSLTFDQTNYQQRSNDQYLVEVKGQKMMVTNEQEQLNQYQHNHNHLHHHPQQQYLQFSNDEDEDDEEVVIVELDDDDDDDDEIIDGSEDDEESSEVIDDDDDDDPDMEELAHFASSLQLNEYLNSRKDY